MEQYWHDALTLDQYVDLAEERFLNNPDKNDEHQEY
jgi:hypothetical protein